MNSTRSSLEEVDLEARIGQLMASQVGLRHLGCLFPPAVAPGACRTTTLAGLEEQVLA